MKHIRITRISNHLSTRKLKELANDPTRTKVEHSQARKLLLKRGETITL